MKNILLLIAIFSLCQTALAQLDIGMTWHYLSYSGYPPPLVDPEVLVLTDTLTIDGKLGFATNGDCGNFFDPIHIALENGVMYWHFDTVGWLKLYNFNLEAGDTDTCFLPPTWYWEDYPHLIYTVDSVGTTNAFNGQPLKVFYFDFDPNQCYCDWTVSGFYEIYGSDQCLFPRYGLNDGQWGGFQCVELDGQTQFSPSGLSCQEILPTENPLFSATEPFTVFPQPVADVVNIKRTNEQFSFDSDLAFTIYDSMGRLIFTKKLAKGNSVWQFEFGKAGAGLYFYEIRSATGAAVQVGKVVRM